MFASLIRWRRTALYEGLYERDYSVFTFRVRRSRGEMYSGQGRLCVCVCVCVSLAAFPYYCTDPDVTWEKMVGGALELCTIGRICNRCMGFLL